MIVLILFCLAGIIMLVAEIIGLIVMLVALVDWATSRVQRWKRRHRNDRGGAVVRFPVPPRKR